MAGSLIGKGSFGAVHEVLDLKSGGSTKMVVKASQDVMMLYKEVRALQLIHLYAKS